MRVLHVSILVSTILVSLILPQAVVSISGNWRWTFQVQGVIPSKALHVSSTGRVYVGSEDCCIYVLNITYDNYEVLWSWNASSEVECLTHLADHNTNETYVVFGTNDGLVYCFKENASIQVWQSPQLGGTVRYITTAKNNSTKVDDVLVCAGNKLCRITGGGTYKGTINWQLVFDKTFTPGPLAGVEYPVCIEASPTDENIVTVGVHTRWPTVGSCRTYCFNQTVTPDSAHNWAIMWTGFTTGTGSTTSVAWIQDITSDGNLEVVAGSGGYLSQGDASDHGEITCFNGVNGSTIWTYSLSKPIYSQLLINFDYTGDGINDIVYGSDTNKIGVVNAVSGTGMGSYTTGGTVRLVDWLRLETNPDEKWIIGAEESYVYGVNATSAPFTGFTPVYSNVTGVITNLIAIEDLNGNGAGEILVSDGNQVALIEGYGNITEVPEFASSAILFVVIAVTFLVAGITHVKSYKKHKQHPILSRFKR